MDGFLVLVRHTMDDLPVALLPTYEEAYKTARNADPMSPKVREIMGTDASTPACVSIVEFRNGVPVRAETVRDLDEECLES